MPTLRNVTPHGILPFILAVPLLLLLFAIPPAVVETGLVEITVHSVPLGFNKVPVSSPWEDGVFTDGIPPDTAENDNPRRNARPSRTIPRDDRMSGNLRPRSRSVGLHLVLIETLLDAFLIGLPPPPVSPVG